MGRPIGINPLPAAMKVARHLANMQCRNKVILIGEIAPRPDQPRGDGLRACFRTQLYLPLDAAIVLNVELRIKALAVFAQKSERSVGGVFGPARSIVEV